MEYMINASEGLPLGLDFIEILIHLLNFVILLVGMRLLLYKPIKRFMVKRESEYKLNEEKSKAAKLEAESNKVQCDKLLNDARQKAVEISEEATASAHVQTKEIINNAKSQAREIVDKAKVDIEHEKTKAKEELLFSVSELAVDIASRILEREIKIDDNDAIIDNILKDWKSNA